MKSALWLLLLIIAPACALSQGAVKAIDLFPLTLNHYVDYDSYVTDNNGLILSDTKTHASVTVMAVNQMFGGKSGVVVVRDTSNATALTSGTATDLRYVATSEGDIQAYADNAFLNIFAPDAFSDVLNAPNTFVDYLKTSAGVNVVYPIAHVNQDITLQGSTVNLDVKAEGTFMGKESLTVNGKSFDSVYKFILQTDAIVKAGIIPILSNSIQLNLWLVPGVGIVRSNSPTVSNTPVPVPGTERQYVRSGNRSLASVPTTNQTSFTLAASVVNHRLTIQNASEMSEMLLYNLLGTKLGCYTNNGAPTIEVPTAHLSPGVYMITGRRIDGDIVPAIRLIVEH